MLVNLQVVIRCNYIGMDCGLTASAQHMTREAGDNCFDEEVGLWYYVSNLSWCHNGPEIWGYPCQYCHQANDSEVDRKYHEWCCPYNPENQAPYWNGDFWTNYWEDSGSSSATGTSYNAGGGGTQGTYNTGGSSLETSNIKGSRTNTDSYFKLYLTSEKYPSNFHDYVLCRYLPVNVHKQENNECLLNCIAFAYILQGAITTEQMYQDLITCLRNQYFNFSGNNVYDMDTDVSAQLDLCLMANMRNYEPYKIPQLLTPTKDNGDIKYGVPIVAFVITGKLSNDTYILSLDDTDHRIVTKITNQQGYDTNVSKYTSSFTDVGTHSVTIVGFNSKTKRYAVYNPWGAYITIPYEAVNNVEGYNGVYSWGK